MTKEVVDWLNQLQLSKKLAPHQIGRALSDGVLLAEIIHLHQPKIVDLHNYTPTLAADRKLENWAVLQRKPLKKLRIALTKSDISDIVNCVMGSAEKLLLTLKKRLENSAASDAEQSPRRNQPPPPLKVPRHPPPRRFKFFFHASIFVVIERF